eukprot:s1998_g2.t1
MTFLASVAFCGFLVVYGLPGFLGFCGFCSFLIVYGVRGFFGFRGFCGFLVSYGFRGLLAISGVGYLDSVAFGFGVFLLFGSFAFKSF